MIRRFFSAFLFLITSVLLLVLSVVGGVYLTLNSDKFYGDEFANIVYDETQSVFLKDLSFDNISYLQKEDFIKIFKEVFTVDDLKDLIKNHSDYVKFSDRDMTIFFPKYKEKIAILNEKLLKFGFENIPKCENDQQFGQDFVCVPSFMTSDTFNSQFGRILNAELLSLIPEKIDYEVDNQGRFKDGFFDFFNKMMLNLTILLLIGSVVLIIIASILYGGGIYVEFKLLSKALASVFSLIIVIYAFIFYGISFVSATIMDTVSTSDMIASSVGIENLLFYFIKFLALVVLKISVPIFVLFLLTFVVLKFFVKNSYERK